MQAQDGRNDRKTSSMVEFTVYCFKSFHGGSHSVGSNIVFGARKERRAKRRLSFSLVVS